jgi:hypothetical protein
MTYSSALNIEAVYFFKTSANLYRTTQNYVLDSSTLWSENTRSLSTSMYTRLYYLWQCTIISGRYISVEPYALISQRVYVGIPQMNKNRLINLVNYYSRWVTEIGRVRKSYGNKIMSYLVHPTL